MLRKCPSPTTGNAAITGVRGVLQTTGCALTAGLLSALLERCALGGAARVPAPASWCPTPSRVDGCPRIHRRPIVARSRSGRASASQSRLRLHLGRIRRCRQS